MKLQFSVQLQNFIFIILISKCAFVESKKICPNFTQGKGPIVSFQYVGNYRFQQLGYYGGYNVFRPPGPIFFRNPIKIELSSCHPSPITALWKYNPLSNEKNFVSDLKIERKTRNQANVYCLFINMNISETDGKVIANGNKTIFIQSIYEPCLVTMVQFQIIKVIDQGLIVQPIVDRSVKLTEYNFSTVNSNSNLKRQPPDCFFNFWVQKFGNKLLAKCESNIAEYERNVTLFVFYPRPVYPYAESYFRNDIQESNCIKIVNNDEACLNCTEFEYNDQAVAILYCADGIHNTSRQIVFPFVNLYNNRGTFFGDTIQDIYTSWEEIDSHKMIFIEAIPSDTSLQNTVMVKCHFSNYYFAHFTMGEDNPTLSITYQMNDTSLIKQWQAQIEISTTEIQTSVTFIARVNAEIQKAKHITATCKAPIWNSDKWVSVSLNLFLRKLSSSSSNESGTSAETDDDTAAIIWASLLGISATFGLLLLILILILIHKNSELNKRIEVHRATIRRRREANNQRSLNMYAEQPHN